MGANTILCGVDMPGILKLHMFGSLCYDAFDDIMWVHLCMRKHGGMLMYGS